MTHDSLTGQLFEYVLWALACVHEGRKDVLPNVDYVNASVNKVEINIDIFHI